MTLTESDFNAITTLWNRASDESSRVELTQVDLADAFEVSQATISAVVHADTSEKLV
jgi:hypothetical protein